MIAKQKTNYKRKNCALTSNNLLSYHHRYYSYNCNNQLKQCFLKDNYHVLQNKQSTTAKIRYESIVIIKRNEKVKKTNSLK